MVKEKGLLLSSMPMTGMSPMAVQRQNLPSATLNSSLQGRTLMSLLKELVQFAVHPESTGARNTGWSSEKASDSTCEGASLVRGTLSAM
jgi:hypothetical protein